MVVGVVAAEPDVLPSTSTFEWAGPSCRAIQWTRGPSTTATGSSPASTPDGRRRRLFQSAEEEKLLGAE
jgi:hypothetical protein